MNRVILLLCSMLWCCGTAPSSIPPPTYSDDATELPPNASAVPAVPAHDALTVTSVTELDLSRVNAAIAFDAMALREVGDFLLGSSGQPVSAVTHQQRGELCSGATNKEECAQALADLDAWRGFENTCMPMRCVKQLALTHRDNVFAVASAAQMLTFFGAIDTTTEAAFLLAAREYNDIHIEAGTDIYRGTATRLTSSCAPLETTRYTWELDGAGTLTILSSEIASSHANVCI